MAIADDNLNVEIGITGVEQFEADIERLIKAARKAEKNIQNAFAANSKVDKDINETILGLQKKVLTVTKSFIALGKAGAEGFGDITERQTKAILKLTELQGKLRQIDKESQGGASKGRLAELEKDAEKILNTIRLLERELVDLQQKDVIIKAKIVPEEKKPPVKPYTDDRDLDRLLKRQSASALDLERQLVRLGQVQGNGSEGIAERAKAGQRQIEILANRIAQLQRLMDVTDDKNIITEMLKDAKALDHQIDVVRRDVTKLRREELYKSPADPLSNKKPLGYNILSGLGIPGLGGALGVAGAGYAVGYGISKFIDLSKEAVDRATEMTRVNRLLASSAAEAGIGYDELTAANKKFAASVGLSEAKAASTTAKITQLATRTQRPEDIGKLQKAFADLGAARGLNATELETVIQQIITGQDEGYKKLLLPNPSQLYQQYAKQQGRSVGSLSAVERSKIFEAEFLKKAELFNGAAEARMATIEGRAAKLNAAFENLANTLSVKFAGNYDVNSFITGLTDSLNGLNSEIDSLASKVQKGINIDELVRQEAKPGVLGGLSAFGNTLLSGSGTLFSGLATTLTGGASNLLGINAALDQSAMNSAVRAQNATDETQRENFIRQQINAEIKMRADLEKTANERLVQLAQDNAKEEYEARQGVFEKEFENTLKGAGHKPLEQRLAALQAELDKVERASQEGGAVFDEAKFNATLAERFSKVDFSKFPGQTQDQVRERLAEQIRKEMNAAIEVSNKPILDEKKAAEYGERVRDQVASAVVEAFQLRANDPRLRIGALNQLIGDVGSDSRIFDEQREKLLDQLEKTREEMAVKARDAARDIQSSLVNSFGDLTENPFIKLIYESETAMDRAVEKFTGVFGPGIAQMMGQIAKAEADARLSFAKYRSSDTALKLQQEASRLRDIPEIQTGSFQRRLDTVEQLVSYVASNRDLKLNAEIDRFFASEYRQGGRSFLENKYGYGALAQMQSKAGGADLSIKIANALEDLAKYQKISTSETGIYGREAIAKALLDRLPSRDELLFRFNNSYGADKEEARTLLEARAKASEDLVKANDQRLKDYLVNQENLDKNIADAQQRLKNLGSAEGLTKMQKLNEYLAITGELGTAELTPELRQGRINALLEKAAEEKAQAEVAAERNKAIDGLISTVNRQLEDQGLKVTLGTVPIVDVNVNTNQLTAEVTNRPNANSTAARGR